VALSSAASLRLFGQRGAYATLPHYVYAMLDASHLCCISPGAAEAVVPVKKQNSSVEWQPKSDTPSATTLRCPLCVFCGLSLFVNSSQHCEYCQHLRGRVRRVGAF